MMEEASAPFIGTSLAGRILIAPPEPDVSEFTSAITLILQHGFEGALGVFLNRPSTQPLSDSFPDWEELGGDRGVLFAGGPVDHDALIALGRPDGAKGGLVLGAHPVDLDEQPALVEAQGISEVRVFSGYASWSAGQLECELAEQGWWVADATIDDVFTSDPESLWARVMKREGGELEWYAHFPDDLSLN